jgi:glutathione S-transferase
LIKVHHLNNSRSQRILWLLEELALEYEVVRYRRDPRTMLAPSSLRGIHPLGKAPIFEDASLRMAETGAIVDYIVSLYGQKLAPSPASEAYWRYRYWLHYAEGSAMPPLLLKLVVKRLGPSAGRRGASSTGRSRFISIFSKLSSRAAPDSSAKLSPPRTS